MQIKPGDHWRWYFDPQYDRMMLHLSEQMQFCSRFPAKMLTHYALQQHHFTVEDAELFFEFDEQCRYLLINNQQRAELVLNALAAQRFLKPMMPKSWYFSLQRLEITSKKAQLVCVEVTETGEHAQLLVVESGESASLCVLAQPQLVLAGKTMRIGDAIKVMNDRLLRFNIVEPFTTYSQAI